MSRLLLHGCDTQARNQAGHTPLDLAVPKSSTARLLEEEAGARSYLQQQRPCNAGRHIHGCHWVAEVARMSGSAPWSSKDPAVQLGSLLYGELVCLCLAPAAAWSSRALAMHAGSHIHIAC